MWPRISTTNPVKKIVVYHSVILDSDSVMDRILGFIFWRRPRIDSIHGNKGMKEYLMTIKAICGRDI